MIINKDSLYIMIINKDSLYIQELRNDSHTAFETLYDMYSDSLYGYVLLHTKSTFSAEEIVQDTFIKIWTNRQNLSTEGSFKALLFTIAKNQIIDAMQKRNIEWRDIKLKELEQL